jgi:probable phosphoglycerate mutase
VTRIVLVRHGEAQAAVDEVIGGDRGCTGLSDLGRLQVKGLAQRLERTGELGSVDAVYASTLPRAIETGEILTASLGGQELIIEPDVKEWDPGPEIDGLRWHEVDARYPPLDPWNPHDVRYPASEPWAEFTNRVGRGLHRIASRHVGETVVVACHGGVIEQSVVAFGGLSHYGEHLSFSITNASLTEWFRPDPDEPWWRPAGRWRLLRLNDAAHLEGVD